MVVTTISTTPLSPRILIPAAKIHHANNNNNNGDDDDDADYDDDDAVMNSPARVNHAINNNNNHNNYVVDSDGIKIKVTYPVLVTSLYKSGTTSLFEYFKCGKQRAIHHHAYVEYMRDGKPIKYHKTGPCMFNNTMKHDLPAFHNCGGTNRIDQYGNEIPPYDIYTDNAFIQPPHVCYDPSAYSLDKIYQHYPNVTIIAAVRDPYEWIESVTNYVRLLRRLLKCKRLWPRWYDRNIIGKKKRAKIGSIEVKLGANDTGAILEERIGIPSKCWGNSNRNDNYDRYNAL